jgi:hypothetical protein
VPNPALDASKAKVPVVCIDTLNICFNKPHAERERELQILSNFFLTLIAGWALCPRKPMLEILGRTPEEVAEALRARGVKGVRNTVRMLNPIVRYAHTCVTDVYGIDIIQGDRLRIVFADGRVSEVAVPRPVLEFLARFHRGQYPDMEMPPGPG